MYSNITWRIFDSLVRHYSKADQNTPKPDTFRQFSNAKLLQIMLVLDGLDDPRYRRSHALHNDLGNNIYGTAVSDVNVAAGTITQGTVVWTVDTMLYGIILSGGAYTTFTARVLAAAAGVYTLDVLSGALIDDAAITQMYVFVGDKFGASWDTGELRFRRVMGIHDFVSTLERPFFGYDRFEMFQLVGKDYAMDAEVAYYSRAGVFQFKTGTDAPTVNVPTVEFDCMPSIYTEQTGDNRIELLPEHLRMLFDGVAAETLTLLNKPQPEDLKARLRDDALTFFSARASENREKALQETMVNK